MSLSTITTTLKYSVSSSKGSSHDSRYDDTEHFNSSGIKNSTKLLSRKDYTILKKYDNKEDFILRGLKNSFPPCRTNDDVHGSIMLDPVSLVVIDTPQMQRLRGLKQLGVTDMAYMTTTHCRFEHSLGVAHLAETILRNIQRNQPNLDITEKDILCVKVAGLCHDLGHGPYSHVYDGEFRRLLRIAERRGIWLGKDFDSNTYNGMPNSDENWAHEDGSLMMVDALLRHLGLAIDDDPSNLDRPLKQIGDGVDARLLGVHGHLGEDGMTLDGKTPLPPNRLMTSRDWIFVKECIVGGPVPPNGMTIANAAKMNEDDDSDSDCDNNDNNHYQQQRQKRQRPRWNHLVGRKHPHQEFLYDVVSNRHSGLDVDKIDYIARDGRRAAFQGGVGGGVNPMLLENACVAWGDCARSQSCVTCKSRKRHHFRRQRGRDKGCDIRVKVGRNSDRVGDENNEDSEKIGGQGYADVAVFRKNQHLMICYPEKMPDAIMNVFKNRFHNHHTLYTHRKAKAVEFMVCDILLLADQHFRISALEEGDGTLTCPVVGRGKNNSSTSTSARENDSYGDQRKRHASLPISRAHTNPDTYLRLTDSVTDLIGNTTCHELRGARQLLNRLKSHKLYKRVAEIRGPGLEGCESPTREDLVECPNVAVRQMVWDMPEEEIVSRIVKCSMLGVGNTVNRLNFDDVIVEKRRIHHGQGEENPMRFIRFVPKRKMPDLLNKNPNDLPLAISMPEDSYAGFVPRAFLTKTLRFYCRSEGKEDLLTTCFYQFLQNCHKDSGSVIQVGFKNKRNDLSPSHSGTREGSMSPAVLLTQSPTINIDDFGAIPRGEKRARKRLFNSHDLDSP